MSDSVRLPVQHATYPGDCTGILADQAKGPNTIGELLYPVTADYDAESDTTRVGFSYLAPPVEVQDAWPVLKATPFGVAVVPR